MSFYTNKLQHKNRFKHDPLKSMATAGGSISSGTPAANDITDDEQPVDPTIHALDETQ